jgi:23S rRNA pseudouridine955/2504/2580 synthase
VAVAAGAAVSLSGKGHVMTNVQLLTVTEDEGEQRLDRWFKRRFPQVTQGAVEKMCRTGQVRVDGKRAKASDRVARARRSACRPCPRARRPGPTTAASAPPTSR